MQDKRYVLCGNASAKGISEDPARDLRLRLSGRPGHGNITLRIEDVHSKLFSSVPSRFHDLLEIATYVYSADQVIRRGADDVDTFGDGWRRDLHFVVPVRDPDFWSSAEVQETLCSTLGFLSDDQYEFDFVKLDQDHQFQEYLEFNDTQQMYGMPEQVVMFSGGLDSLAGAIDEVVNQKRRVLLVTHKSTSKLNKRHRVLEEMLAAKAGDNVPHRITVRVHKTKELNHEYTQRSRSFLYVSIGATIARMLNLKSVRFYENGVISLNLPVCAQVVGGRATRTTHPRVMKGFQDLLSLVAGEPFTVENPYIWKTKADVVKIITDAGCHDLIKHSMTCTHTWEMTNQHTHCGGCSQCIDRRFAILAAKANQHDPVEHYKVDVFTQSRDKGEDKIMAAAYLERANQVKNLTDVTQFISSYPDVGRVLKYLNYSSAGQAAQRVFDLYKRHADEVTGALDELGRRYFTQIRERSLPGDCLLRTVYESASVNSVPAVISMEKQPENFFRKRGAVWETRFQGRNTICLLNVDKGAEYINLLLAFPDREMSVYEIAVGNAVNTIEHPAGSGIAPEDIEDGYQVTQGIPLGDAGDVADRRALNECKQQARELFEEMEEARERGDHARIEEIEKEMAALVKYIEGGKGLGGRQRRVGDKRKNVRDAFRNAVDRAIRQIEKYDKPLAEHLKASIKYGNEVVYRPGMAITWEVRPIVNG
ncbi:7-cyano-7-deazaguanine synthase [Ralstonia mannitolilytica]|uniref:7-cyano-7-deazaguanine synthase n=1 Tax=Ralstonia mannitolilytica TaxID=105219 RepID=UPI0028F69D21|nr:7-cyano-7-deazaguanine synthase [Ralstonia mannitolilytica]CAJ0867482.1 7-cyano-7-deazaguanine synthase [Ralstonia mannitolilytica]